MFNIAILGMGVVGGGVYEVIKNNASAISHKLGGNGEPLFNKIPKTGDFSHKLL